MLKFSSVKHLSVKTEVRKRPNPILWNGKRGQIIRVNSFRTDDVNIVPFVSENFFKMGINTIEVLILRISGVDNHVNSGGINIKTKRLAAENI